MCSSLQVSKNAVLKRRRTAFVLVLSRSNLLAVVPWTILLIPVTSMTLMLNVCTVLVLQASALSMVSSSERSGN